ncbi:hypothetical protein Q7P37_010186 [Cladosporium fusiforme]
MPQLHNPQAQAQTQVLATTELLELIHLCLPPKTLFAIQRVCQKWNDLIKSSLRLQERMFLRAPPASRVHVSDEHPQHSEGQNMQQQNSPSLALCPILSIATQFVRTHPDQIAASCSQSALRGQPSWHQMLLTIPPCKEATVALWWRTGDSMRGSVYLESVRNSDGLRFADVVKAAFEQKAGNWKAMPDGKLRPLSDVGDVTLERFLEGKAGGDVRMMDSTSVFFLRVP